MTGFYKDSISRLLDSRLQKMEPVLLSGVSFSVVVLAGLSSTPVQAANYVVNSETELNNAVTAANASGDPRSTIIMGSSFSITAGAMPLPTSAITIDTNGHVLSGIYDGSTAGTKGALSILPSSGTGVGVTLSGAIVGASSGTADTTTGQVGVWVNRTSLTNNGTITGGDGLGTSGAGSAGGAGARIFSGSSLVNTGTIVGGNSTLNAAGAGVEIGGLTPGPGTLLNQGTIRGGTGAITGGTAGAGLEIRAGAGAITNTGTIEGGDGGIAIVSNAATANMNIVNSGTIRAGNGQTDAINRSLAATTGVMTLELQAGSVIIGNVVAGAAVSTDKLILGGSGTDTFDVSTIGPQYQNFDIFQKTGTGTWFLTGTDAASTNWDIDAGTLAVNGTVGGAVNVLSGGRLQGIGQVGNTTNAGTITPGNSIGTLTIAGDYTGNGGTLEIESVLGGDTSSTDKLVITGNSSGNTNVKVVNLGGAGGQTVNGIKIVDVGGTSAGTFSLLGDYTLNGEQVVVGGAYVYGLYQGGISTPADGDWYLRSSGVLQPGVPVYQAYPLLMLLGLNQVGTLQQRIGGRTMTGDAQVVSGGTSGWGAGGIEGWWVRTEGTHGRLKANDGTVDTSHEYDLGRMQAGLDGEVYRNGDGRLIGGLTAQYGTISSDLRSSVGNGRIDTSGYGIGGTLTWYGDGGSYVDAQSQMNFYDSDLKSDLLASPLKSGSAATGYILSIETGHRFDTAGSLSFTPQAQLTYSAVDFGSFHDRFGAQVSLDRGDSLSGRLGLAVDREESWQAADGRKASLKLYGAANLYHEFLDGVSVNVAGSRFSSRGDDLSAGVSFGGSYSWGDEHYSLYGEVAAKSSLKEAGDNLALGGSLSLRVKW